MHAEDRTVLLDLENHGTLTRRPRPMRARLQALLTAAGEHHRAVAAYALADGESDLFASLLAELRIAPLRVAPAPDAVELALLAHACYVHKSGGRIFLVASGDNRFAELATAGLGRVELLLWEGQPAAAKLTNVAHVVHRVPPPTRSPHPPTPNSPLATQTTDGAAHHDGPNQPETTTSQQIRPPSRHAAEPCAEPRSGLTARSSVEQMLSAVVTGMATAAGQRLFEALARSRRR